MASRAFILASKRSTTLLSSVHRISSVRSYQGWPANPYGGGPSSTTGSRPGSLPVNLGINVVPQSEVWIVERFGKFAKTLEAGLHFLVPAVDRIAYTHSLKEIVIQVPNQAAVCKDNVAISCEGVLYVRIIDPVRASYEIENVLSAISLLAQTTMRSEIGKLTLDKTFEERDTLNTAIVRAIEAASQTWGVQCLRYEIRDISVPENVRHAMELQAEAERRKRKQILESEGQMKSQMNVAEGAKTAVELASEAEKVSMINRASGEASAIRQRAEAVAEGVERLSAAIVAPGGKDAIALRLAEQYIAAFGNVAQKTNTVIVPANVSDASGMIAQAMTIYESIGNKTKNASVAKEQALDYLLKQADIQQYLEQQPRSTTVVDQQQQQQQQQQK